MGKVIKLRQSGKDWHETRGMIFRAIMSGIEFESGKMTAERYEELAKAFYGRLPEPWNEVFFSDQPDYVVFSFNTPIAWHVPEDGDNGAERWVVPKIKYSATTSRHQNIVRTALVFNGSGYLEDLERAQQGR